MRYISDAKVSGWVVPKKLLPSLTAEWLERLIPVQGVMGSIPAISDVIKRKAYIGGWIYPEYSLARACSVFRFWQFFQYTMHPAHTSALHYIGKVIGQPDWARPNFGQIGRQFPPMFHSCSILYLLYCRIMMLLTMTTSSMSSPLIQLIAWGPIWWQ